MKPDLVCTQCPLLNCDDGSLWCLYRLLTGDPNAAQRRYITKRLTTKRKQTKRAYSRQYNKKYYREHREEKRAYDRERYLARKREKVA